MAVSYYMRKRILIIMMHNLSSKMISYAIIFVGVCIICFICVCNFFFNIPLYFIKASDQVSASRMLSSNTDYYTGENLRTVEGQIPLVSCPLGYNLI